MLLKFDISAFTNTGTVRSSNQDHILVNDVLLNEGEIDLLEQEYYSCFVADGIGGHDNYLTLDTKVPIHESLSDDLFLICSDSLFKSINQKIVKSILKKADKDLPTKIKKILDNCLITGAEDNISAIFIHQIL